MGNMGKSVPCNSKNKDKGKMSAKQRQAISKGMRGKKKSSSQKQAISEGMKNSKCVRYYKS